MSLQSRGREKYLRSLKKRNIKKSLKEEEKEALAVQNKYRKKGKTESGIAYVAKSIQAEHLLKKKAERLLKKKEDQKKKVAEKKVVKKPVVKKTKPTRAPGSEDFEPQSLADQKTHPDMSTVNKPDAKKKPKASDDRRKWGRDQMKRARASMGMKHGGVVKRTKMGKVRTANPRNIDGIAKRGLTRAKHR